MSTGAKLAALVSMVAGLLLGLPAIAWSEPAGCTSKNVDFYVDSTGYMTNTGSGQCSAAATRTLRVEIKQDISFQPDPLVAANSDYGTKTQYYQTVGACDHGKTATYYGRTYFTSSPTYHDSTHYKKHVC